MQTIKTENALIRAHGLMALFMVLVSATAGIVVAIKFNWPGFLGESAPLTWGQLRCVHTQGIFFGWIGKDDQKLLARFVRALFEESHPKP